MWWFMVWNQTIRQIGLKQNNFIIFVIKESVLNLFIKKKKRKPPIIYNELVLTKKKKNFEINLT